MYALKRTPRIFRCSNWGYRYYQPDAARFLSRDPIGERGGLNLYGYVNNGPIDKYDPLGLVWGPILIERAIQCATSSFVGWAGGSIMDDLVKLGVCHVIKIHCGLHPGSIPQRAGFDGSVTLSSMPDHHMVEFTKCMGGGGGAWDVTVGSYVAATCKGGDLYWAVWAKFTITDDKGDGMEFMRLVGDGGPCKEGVDCICGCE